MTIRKYNPIIDKVRTKDENYIPTGVYFNYLVDALNTFGGDGIIIFANSTARELYLSNPDAKAGQIASDLSDTSKIYVINGDKSTWVEVGTGVTTSPGGDSTHIQFNDRGVFAGSSNFTIDGSKIESKLPLRYATELNLSTDTDLTYKSWVNAAITASLNSVISLVGTWDADSGLPDLSGVTTVGHTYIISKAGTTNLGGITDWGLGDWAVKTSTGWAKIPVAVVDLSWVNLDGLPVDNTAFRGEMLNYVSRNNVTPSVTASTLTFNFDSRNECYAVKSGGGSIVVNEDITIAYSNTTKFKTLAAFISVTDDTRTLTFPANHISGDYRWSAGVLTLPVGIYQLSVMFDGTNYHVLCSEAEV